MQRISRDDLRALLDAGSVTLVEALPEPHYDAEHLPGAVNLPSDLTAELAAQLASDSAGTVVTYCSGPSCGRSKVAAAAFGRLGYRDVRVYEGGKMDWAAAGLPFEGSRTAPRMTR
ncbi:rhodanese-like domain-containing protein [Actinoplanes flavus]|uniref:thiosulfate sulfurtransferase n=1 Tax=Actinoplanes flavus TaxID=2820290 RepID=A0ABS3UVU9_9ACTN|nr:rhodanese-like domain-containing protein [Actinoplanes flavus]MBO3742671.1 rhodanese-like domain-containing protein [Actinoplanes flavus]